MTVLCVSVCALRERGDKDEWIAEQQNKKIAMNLSLDVDKRIISICPRHTMMLLVTRKSNRNKQNKKKWGDERFLFEEREQQQQQQKPN